MKFRNLFEDENSKVKAFANAIKQKYGLLDFDLYLDSNGNLELNRIQVPRESRGQGIGAQVMQDLTNFADQNGLLIWMSVAEKNKEMGTTSRNRLLKFYRQFGFKKNMGRYKRFDLSMYATMYRDPK